CVAWRAGDLRPAVLGFVKVATGASGDAGGPVDSGDSGEDALRDIGVHPGRWSGWTPAFIADGDTGSGCSPFAYGCTWSRQECSGRKPRTSRARSMASRVPCSPTSRVSLTWGYTSARSSAEGRSMTVSAAAMMKAGLPLTA